MSLTLEKMINQIMAPPEKPKAIKIDPWNRDQLFAGRPGAEQFDCAVRAFVVATGKPYAEVHAVYKRYGRKTGRKTPNSVTKKVADHFGLKWVERRCRVSTLLDDMEHAKQPIAVLIYGHFFGVAKGAVQDYQGVPPRCIVKGYFTY